MFSEPDIVNRVDAFAARMQRGYFHRKVLRLADWDYEAEITPLASRRRSKKRSPLKPAEVMAICHEALVLKQHHSDIAKRHNLSLKSISNYACKARKSKDFIAEVYSK